MAGPLRVHDDRHRVLDFASPPRRVVSLVPSDTLNVAALGAGAALVGRTDYCELPEDVAARVPSVGGTKDPRIPDVLALEPDLVIANQEENSRGDLEAIAQHGVRVYVAFPKRVADGLAHLAKLARIFRVEREPAVRALLKRGYEALRDAAPRATPPLPTFCPIWMNPLMTIHADTFISDMMLVCGAENVFADRERRYPLAADLGRGAPLAPDKTRDRDVRYPRITLEEVVARAPQAVILPDEPHPFTDEDAAVFRGLPIPAARRGAILHVSGKDLCWYGARSVEGIGRVRALLERLAEP
ncbi:MAG TPA: helical backbone metal receptor [Polyangiaceae bacterium]|nr:helical backbone metal receptor [Polyangiaceae bacterium]